jgi:hypothetical protein
MQNVSDSRRRVDSRILAFFILHFSFCITASLVGPATAENA